MCPPDNMSPWTQPKAHGRAPSTRKMTAVQLVFRLPSPFRVNSQGGRQVGSTKRRAILAGLALEANRVVPADRLSELVWAGRAPQSAHTVLQGHVASLRGLFDDSVRVVTRESGYVLETDPVQIDVHQHHVLVARAAAEDDHLAVESLR